ncbi:Nramp family divalent metal transporter [Shewanella sp. SG41-4]|uniref:Nramp family divalent metal transporter n=1 Tax=Shewanella sp. SG41-4 TaxID=2760976 RepID=UPI0015FEE97E|nr:Nramp family divalent metal transporter [Shewanella sp. SG41-4]MBB1438234.1 Nramp family divalent metal transporter [Shewanella sp. SG41-4]
MLNQQTASAVPWISRVNTLFKATGPGILMAAAAIGASHLVASTRAGAEFGWQLAWLILLVNIVKYPFFAAGARYTAATDESLLHGYQKQGRGYLMLFTGLNVIAAIASTAGVCMLTAAMLTQFIPLSIDVLALIVLASSLALLIFGHYKLLDKMTKIIMLALTITTLVAVALAFNRHSGFGTPVVSESPWQWAYVGFLVAMMGWMPAPIEVSTWNSLWLIEKRKTQIVTAKQAIFDFNLGYVTTALLAIVFLALGALVMHGSGERFSDSGAVFASQLITLYSQVMGNESRYLIGIVAFLCIFSTTVTVIDGYSRTLDMGWKLLSNNTSSRSYLTQVMLVVSALGLLLILFFKGSLLPLLEFVMILAFMTTIIFAWLNFRLMTSDTLAKKHRYGPVMVGLSWIGLLYLVGFAVLFIYWYLTK